MMKKYCVLILFLVLGLSTRSQDLYRLTVNSEQRTDNYQGRESAHVDFPYDGITVVLGGLNSWGGLDNYLNIRGEKLLIDDTYKGNGGIQNVVLRREDGQNFFNLFPTLNVTLTPLHQIRRGDQDTLQYEDTGENQDTMESSNDSGVQIDTAKEFSADRIPD